MVSIVDVRISWPHKVNIYTPTCVCTCAWARVCAYTWPHVLLLISTPTATVWQLRCAILVCKSAAYVLAHLN